MRQLALISVWNKEGVGSIARALEAKGFELLATGKTRSLLESEGFKVIDVSDLTGEPERFGGRLKTLHHKVLGALLFRPGQDESEWPYDFRIGAVVCNFYPFLQEAEKAETVDAMMEWIDIGGPTMVRSAAKNFKHVWVFTRPEQYTRYIASIETDVALRERFALEAFESVSELDEAIVYHFQTRQPWDGGGRLTYGENPHQKSEFLPNRRLGPKFYKAFSFNNIRDAEAVIKFLRPFSGLNAACVVKHQTLCGAAVGIKSSDSAQVFEEAWEGDPTSRFGGVVGLNFTPSSEVVSTFEKKFIEVLVLPRNDQTEALAESLSKKKDKLKILLVSDNALKPDAKRRELVRGQLGELMQDSDSLTLETNADRDLQKLLKSFGEWCAACSKSNAIALVAGIDSKNLVTLAGAGQGQPNRIDSLERLALPRAIDFCARRSVSVNQLVCVSDAFLPFDDCIKSLAQAGVKRLIQPGGSKADEKVAATANQLGVSMELTGRRHFWH